MITRPFFKVLLLLAFMGLFSACASQNLVSLHSATGLNQASTVINKQQKILVVNSNQSVERYQMAESVFIDSVSEYQSQIINLEAEARPIDFLQDILNQHQFDVIYCIGAKALGSIDYIDPNVPVVYSSVMNWRRFVGRANYYGIASELAPQVQLTWFKYFFPEIKKIGVLYSEENQFLIDDAERASANLSLELNALKLRANNQLLQSAKLLLKEVDALWLISDSSTLSSVEDVDKLFKLSEKYAVPVFSYNPLFMEMGAVMSLVADLPTTARQAALLSMKLLEKQQPQSAIQYPAGSRIILDSQRVNDYKMILNPDYLDSVDELR